MLISKKKVICIYCLYIIIKYEGNYFVVVQVEQTEFPSKLVKSQKYRTEIDAGTEFPQFHKSFFEFKNISLGNRIVLKFGIYKTKLGDSYQGTSRELFVNLKLY